MPQCAKKLLTAAFVLTGLRTDRNIAERLFQGVRAMRDSTTYQAILEEGGIAATHRVLLRQGRKRFGEPNAATRAALEALTDLDRLEQLGERLLEVDSWQNLLKVP